MFPWVLIQSTDFAPEAWQSLSNQYQVDFLTMVVLKAKTKHDMWNLLTPEQQADAKENRGCKNKKQGKKGKKHQNQ